MSHTLWSLGQFANTNWLATTYTKWTQYCLRYGLDFYIWMNWVSTNRRRCYIYNILSLWLRPYSVRLLNLDCEEIWGSDYVLDSNSSLLSNPLIEIKPWLFYCSRFGSTEHSGCTEHGRRTACGWVEQSQSGICYCNSFNTLRSHHFSMSVYFVL